MRTGEQLVNSASWRKSSRSVGNGACVEIAPAAGSVAVRDTTDRIGPMLQYTASAWRAFIVETKIGAFDVDR